MSIHQLNRLINYTRKAVDVYGILHRLDLRADANRRGLLILWHGTQKLFGYPMAMPMEAPGFIMYVAGQIELVGGFLVMVGFMTRWDAFLCSGLMGVAYWMAHGSKALFPLENGGELAVLSCAVLLFISAQGPSVWSVDEAKGKTLKGSFPLGQVETNFRRIYFYQFQKEGIVNRKIYLHIVALSIFMGMFFILASTGQADTLSEGHRNVNGVVTAIKGDIVTVKTPTGNLTLSQKNAKQHGHAEYKEGDEVAIMVDENNTVIEAHHKGEEGHHHFYTGELVYMGKMKKEIKLETIDGEKVFPLGRLEVKTKNIKEGEVVTVEVNEGGIVIDLHRGAHGEKKH